MKRLLASLRSGDVHLAEGPAPSAPPGGLLIAVTRSLVSAGTERAMVNFGRASLLEKARSQPDKIAQTFGKLRTDGWAATRDAILSKLDTPVPLGYSAVGRVIAAGGNAAGFRVGDRVVTNQPHATYVTAMPTMAARIPDAVPDDLAAFAVVGAVGLQGIRLIAPTLGESVAVFGLGLIGLLAVQLLRASGARVVGIDPDPRRRALAEGLGITALDTVGCVTAVSGFARAAGVDAVLITAATNNRALIGQAAQMCRARGRIVLTGVAPLNLSRDDFYRKELTFQVSAAYGPGRYDPAYEAGHDYPLAHVRWTMKRNLQSVLDMLAERRIAVEPLISHRFAFAEATNAFALLTAEEPSLGILLEYPAATSSPARAVRVRESNPTEGGVSVIGSGQYATRVLIPALEKAGARLRVLVDNGGASGPRLAAAHGFAIHASDVAAAFEDAGTSAIVVATRHDSHANLALRALAHGKHVFLEKPLALTFAEIDQLEEAHAASARVLCVGFNRRFSPHVVSLRAALARLSGPVAMIMTVNAGALPAGHWAIEPAQGGRLVGEGCHFIDLLRHLAGRPIASVSAQRMRDVGLPEDEVDTVTLSFEEGSIGTIHYFANGHPAVSKERLEVFAGGRTYILDNFRRTRAHGDAGFSTVRTARPEKGQVQLVRAFLAAAAGELAPPIAREEIFEVARATLLADTLAREG